MGVTAKGWALGLVPGFLIAAYILGSGGPGPAWVGPVELALVVVGGTAAIQFAHQKWRQAELNKAEATA